MSTPTPARHEPAAHPDPKVRQAKGKREDPAACARRRDSVTCCRYWLIVMCAMATPTARTGRSLRAGPRVTSGSRSVPAPLPGSNLPRRLVPEEVFVGARARDRHGDVPGLRKAGGLCAVIPPAPRGEDAWSVTPGCSGQPRARRCRGGDRVFAPPPSRLFQVPHGPRLTRTGRAREPRVGGRVGAGAGPGRGRSQIRTGAWRRPCGG